MASPTQPLPSGSNVYVSAYNRKMSDASSPSRKMSDASSPSRKDKGDEKTPVASPPKKTWFERFCCCCCCCSSTQESPAADAHAAKELFAPSASNVFNEMQVLYRKVEKMKIVTDEKLAEFDQLLEQCRIEAHRAPNATVGKHREGQVAQWENYRKQILFDQTRALADDIQENVRKVSQATIVNFRAK